MKRLGVEFTDILLIVGIILILTGCYLLLGLAWTLIGAGIISTCGSIGLELGRMKLRR